jgi:predicted RNA-binding protein with PUA-like domain
VREWRKEESFKSKLRSTWERWMMNGVKDYTESGKIRRVSYKETSLWILDSCKAVSVTGVNNGFQNAFGDTSTPEIDHEESTSENKLSGETEEIINALPSFDCDSNKDFVGFE